MKSIPAGFCFIPAGIKRNQAGFQHDPAKKKQNPAKFKLIPGGMKHIQARFKHDQTVRKQNQASGEQGFGGKKQGARDKEWKGPRRERGAKSRKMEAAGKQWNGGRQFLDVGASNAERNRISLPRLLMECQN